MRSEFGEDMLFDMEPIQGSVYVTAPFPRGQKTVWSMSPEHTRKLAGGLMLAADLADAQMPKFELERPKREENPVCRALNPIFYAVIIAGLCWSVR